MMWTTDQKLDSLLRLPWTIRSEISPEGDRLLRVAEIASAVGSGSSDSEAVSDLWESIRASLAAYLHFEDSIPLPEGSTLPWSVAPHRYDGPVVAIIVRQRRESFLNEPTQEHDATGAAADWESTEPAAA